MSEAPELLLHHHLKKLRLPTFLSDYEKLAKQCAAENRTMCSICFVSRSWN